MPRFPTPDPPPPTPTLCYTTAMLAKLRGSQDRAIIGLLVLLGAVAAGARFNDQLIGLTGDNAEYIILSRALISGSPYANAEYPWGYPALLTPFLAAAGQVGI